MKIGDAQIAIAAMPLIDAGYHLGPGVDGSYDCVTMVLKFYGNLGVDMPSEFQGFTLQNYAERWAKGEGRQELFEFLSRMGSAVKHNFWRSGDLMIFQGTGVIFPGVYLGSNHVLCAFEKGCKVVPFTAFKHALVICRRLF